MTTHTVELVELEPAPVVVLPRRVRSDALGDEIGKSIQRVEAAVTAAQVPVAGAPFVRYLDMGPEMEIEVGIPLAGSHAVPTLRASLLPGGPAVTTWHVGPYSGLAGAFAELEAWISEHAQAAGPPWESYWTGPEADLPRVQLVWPVRLR
ncbi:MAG TPA: GyrI-like domain-containing protein [Acidimicrobiia bacterium]|nr:GyrI-like domain-containing protein [Acidimicrobiia bacterium]